MAVPNSNATFSGDSNQGVEVGLNSGHIHVNFGSRQELPLKLAPSSTVPFRRDPDFVDRDILAQIEGRYLKPASRIALYGLGGVGKSQLAIEYSYRVREKSPHVWVFWVYASNSARFRESYRTIANRVELSGRNEPTADILQLVFDWLCDETHGQWVMILDNADDPDLFFELSEERAQTGASEVTRAAFPLHAYLPQTRNGSILITSRNKDAAARLTGRYEDTIKVAPMDESHALRLFKRKAQSDFDERVALRLLKALDCVPLAISQAAAYINQRAPRITVMRYLEDFNKSEKNIAHLLNEDAGDLWRDREASNSIFRTWQLSFEHIRAQRSSAARLLSLMSLCDRQGIPAFLLRYGYEDDSSDLDIDHNVDTDVEDDEEDDEKEFEDDIWTLTNYCLIRTTDGPGDLFEMHRIVQLSTRRWLELNKESERWKKKYVFNMSKAFPPGNDYQKWTICQALFPHAQLLLEYQGSTHEYLEDWIAVLYKAGWYAKERGDYLTAETLIRRVLESTEKVLGVEHPDTLSSVNNLATVLQDQRKDEMAETLHRRALEGREKVLGVEHPDTLGSVNNLALVLRNQRKYEVAETLHRRALEGREKVLGVEHPDTLSSVNNLALVLQDQGKYEVAETLHRRALESREKVLGVEHPDTLRSVDSLAYLFHIQQQYDDASVLLYRRALTGYQRVLGPEHPYTQECSQDYTDLINERDGKSRKRQRVK